MVDSGASSCFIHKRLIDLYNILVTKKKSPRQLKVIDGREISSGLVDTECILKLSLGSHKEELVCNIAEIGRHDIVLGMSWLKKHNPTIDWPNKRVIFDSSLCTENCLASSNIILGNADSTVPEGVPEDLGE